MKLNKKVSVAGFLVEFLKNSELDEKEFGQIYVATLAPGAVRGNHYHEEKHEYFIVIGKVKVVLENIKTKERQEIILDSSEDSITRLYIKPFTAHTFHNISDKDVVLVVYTQKEYHLEEPDTHKYDIK